MSKYPIVVGLGGHPASGKSTIARHLVSAYGYTLFDEAFRTDWPEARIHEQLDLGNRVVLTGVRYENELQMIQFMGKAWWIDRPGFGDTGSHASENSVDPGRFDRTVTNNGTVEQLHNLVSYVMES